MGQLEIIKGGLQCSIQDSGRKGFASWGVPYSGAMDSYSFNLANYHLRNDPNDACLEIGPAPMQAIFHENTVFVITGIEAKLILNKRPIYLNKIYQAEKGDHLIVSSITKGNWIYLSVKEGFKTSLILSSRSWSKGIFEQTQLKKGDLLPYNFFSTEIEPNQNSHLKHPIPTDEPINLMAYKGNDWKILPSAIQKNLTTMEFMLGSVQDRMGFEILGLEKNKLPELLTAPVFPGTIQLTPSGRMIALMREAQVTGGYPRVLQLDDQSINYLSQQRVYSKIKFQIH